MSIPEIILLDSDDDEDPVLRPDVGATASIMNSTPLDLSSLGIGSMSAHSVPNGEIHAQVLKNRENQTSASSQPNKKNTAANRIKSKTAVGYTQQVLPLRQLPSIMAGYQKPVQSVQNNVIELDDDDDDDEPVVVRSITPKEFDWRDKEDAMNRGNNQLPQPIRLSRAEIRGGAENYNFEVFDRTNGDSDHVKCDVLKFKCSYGVCRQVIVGNCAFINHLWAHVSSWKEVIDIETDAHANSQLAKHAPDPRKIPSDVDQLSACPQCLSRFHTPYLMQVHYTRTHSRQVQAVDKSTCYICERDIGMAPNALRQHLSIHQSTDAPYNCKKCKYRCTIRLHLVDHFMREHADTSALMCPFCTYTMVVPVHKLRRSSLIHANDFVRHIVSHENDPRVTCEMCACSFSNPAAKARHKRDHAPVNSKWTFRERLAETRSRLKSHLALTAEKKIAYCAKCLAGNKVDRASDEKCVDCLQLAFVQTEIARRCSVGGLQERLGIDTTQSVVNSDRSFLCSCGFSTRDGTLIIAHWKRCQSEIEVEEDTSETSDYKESEAADIEESKVFSIYPDEYPTSKDKWALGNKKSRPDDPLYYNLDNDLEYAMILDDNAGQAQLFRRHVESVQQMVEENYISFKTFLSDEKQREKSSTVPDVATASHKGECSSSIVEKSRAQPGIESSMKN